MFRKADSSVLAHLHPQLGPCCRLSDCKSMFLETEVWPLEESISAHLIQILLTEEACESKPYKYAKSTPLLGPGAGQSPCPVHLLEPGFALFTARTVVQAQSEEGLTCGRVLPVCTLLPSLASTWLPDWSFSNKHQIRSKPRSEKYKLAPSCSEHKVHSHSLPRRTWSLPSIPAYVRRLLCSPVKALCFLQHSPFFILKMSFPSSLAKSCKCQVAPDPTLP